MFQHEYTHAHPHHFTTHLSAHEINRMHLTHLKPVCYVPVHTHTHTHKHVTHSLLSTNDHSLISCGITGRQSASFTSCKPVGNPPPAALNAEVTPASWSDLRVGISISFTYVTDLPQNKTNGIGFLLLLHIFDAFFFSHTLY